MVDVLIVRITESWTQAPAGGWPAAGLYECTKGIWRVANPQGVVDYVIPVSKQNGGLVAMGCFRVKTWRQVPMPWNLPANHANYPHRWAAINLQYTAAQIQGRWEFCGARDANLNPKFLGRQCNPLGQNPVRYGSLVTHAAGTVSVVDRRGAPLIP